mgnify:FL=1|tara:strand:- start:649 stop:1197 length:549 start_codon:yes stop_codon:yes gene_type:complete
MKGFKKIAVLTDVYEMGKGKQVSVNEKVGDPILTQRIFSLSDANKRNADYKNKRRWIEIDWEKTALLQLEAGNLDWVDYALEEKKLECKSLKRAIEFPVKDDYREALEDGEELKQYNDYIVVVENQIDIIKGIEFKPKAVEIDISPMDKLKSIIKEEGLGIRVGKDDTIEDVELKIKEAKSK